MQPAADPSPQHATSVAELVEQLRALKVWRGNPSVRELARRVAAQRATQVARAGLSVVETPTPSTVGHCFNVRRRRLDLDLFAELLVALGLDRAERAEWMRAARRVHAGAPRREPSPPPPVSFDDAVPSDVVRRSVVDDVVAQRRVLLSGLAGVGKSTVARAAAVRLAGAGATVLTVDVAAASVELVPPTDSEILREVVRALGTRFGADPIRLGRTGPELLAQVQGLLRQHPVVLVIDNVDRSEQVQWVAQVPSVASVLTSRRRLRPPSFATIHLEPLPEHDSERLLRALLGTDTAADDLHALAALSGGLPLTLRSIAASVARHPDWSLADNLARVRDEPGLLGIDEALGRSYARWGAATQELFLLLAGWPTRTVPGPVVAVVAEQTGAAVDELRHDSVVEIDRDGTVRMHDLVRAFGSRRAAGDLRASRRAQVWTSAVAGYITTLHAASQAGSGPADDPHGHWVELRAQLPAFALALRAHGMVEPLTELALAITPVADRFGDYDLARQVVDAAVDASGRPELYLAQARLHRRLGELGRARRALRRGLDVVPPGPDAVRGELEELAGIVELGALRFARARTLLEQAVATFAAAGVRPGQVRAIMALGIVAMTTGDPDSAVAAFERAMAVVEPDDALLRGTLLGNLGEIHLARGDHEAAVSALDEAVRLKQAHGAAHDEGGLRVALALALAHRGDPGAALAQVTTVRELAATLGDELLVSTVECRAGDVFRVLGDPATARLAYSRALALAEELDADYCRIRAEEGLAMLALDRGDPDALDQLRDVLDSFRDVGAGDADRVAALLHERTS